MFAEHLLKTWNAAELDQPVMIAPGDTYLRSLSPGRFLVTVSNDWFPRPEEARVVDFVTGPDHADRSRLTSLVNQAISMSMPTSEVVDMLLRNGVIIDE